MKLLIQFISLCIFIKAEAVDTQELVSKKSLNKTLPSLKSRPKIEDSASSSSEEDGILIKISENKKKKSTSSSKLQKDKLKGVSKDKPLLKQKPLDMKKVVANPIPSTLPKKAETFSPIDSTYKTPTSDFLLKDFESKSVKISFTKQEIKDLENFSKGLESFLPTINRVSVVVKNIIKSGKKEDASKSKPSELFNIKVIEVSDGANTN